MHKIIFIFLCLVAPAFHSQITLNTTYTISPVLTKFTTIGYKYSVIDAPAQQIRVYNTNHSLYNTINIPATPHPINKIIYLSENLFDTDNQIEYALITYTNSPLPGLYKLYIFKENGTQMFFRDTASLVVFSNFPSNIFANTEPIFFDGTSTKMRVNVGLGNGNRFEIYSLPGTIPCNACISGTIAGKSNSKPDEETKTLFYPNPATDMLKLKYKLPVAYKTAEIQVRNSNGKIIETLEVTNDFEFIYLPAEYNSGLYLYTLIVDGVIIKTEKVVLSK